MKHVLEIQKDLKNTGLFMFFITDTYLLLQKVDIFSRTNIT